jgi:hypothetical protein
VIKFGKYYQAITVFDKQVEFLIKKWYNKTRIIDIITLWSMECAKPNWDCKNWTSDIWPMQINQIHRKEYKHSKKLFDKKKYDELYKYQVEYVNRLIDSYEKWNCSEEAFEAIWRKKTNEERFKCIARSYNWSYKKVSYGELAWIKRNNIKKYLTKNFSFLIRKNEGTGWKKRF